MQILNTSNKTHYDENGRFIAKRFAVQAGKKAYLTLSAHSSAHNRIEFPIKRVIGKVGSECEDHEGAEISPPYRIDGKSVFLGYHVAEDKIVSDRIVIDWPGEYRIDALMNTALNDPCYPVIIELHHEA